MAVYLKKFENHTQYEAYINGDDAILPNVSICTTEGDVHINPWVETRVVATFNVTSTTSPTKIGYEQYTSGFSAIEIDGIEQPSVVSAYTFSTTGEHTVKYTLLDETSIGERTFYNCSGLTSIVIPDSVTSIGNQAFFICRGLTSATIGSGVTSIGNNAFQTCTSLTSINIPDNVTSIGASAFAYCSGLTSINIPDSVTSIGASAFSYCRGLTSATIGSGVTSIGNNAFSYCNGLTSIVIPDSVTSIGNNAFHYCQSLTSIDIPDSVTSIGVEAFRYCLSLTSIVCNATTAPTINYDTFRNVKADGTLYVPAGSTGYDVWMGTSSYYLGLYNWTKVEQ